MVGGGYLTNWDESFLYCMLRMTRNYDIKPIKTTYGGIKFKARIEARWAVFFDTLGIRYEYEPFYSEVETGCRVVYYKPDFYLCDLNLYLEIKHSKPYEMERIKAAGWAKHIDNLIVLFNLNVPTMESENGWLFYFPEISKVPILSECFWWGECPKCGHIDIAQYAQITSCGCYDINYYNDLYESEDKIGHGAEKTSRLLKAYSIAKNYKFVLAEKKADKILSQGFLFP